MLLDAGHGFADLNPRVEGFHDAVGCRRRQRRRERLLMVAVASGTGWVCLGAWACWDGGWSADAALALVGLAFAAVLCGCAAVDGLG